MKLLQFLYAIMMLVLSLSALMAIIGTVTVAATVGGGPLFGLAVFAILVVNACIWGEPE